MGGEGGVNYFEKFFSNFFFAFFSPQLNSDTKAAVKFQNDLAESSLQEKGVLSL